MYYFIVSMFDEHEQVEETVKELSTLESRVFIVQSDDSTNWLDDYKAEYKSKLPNLESQFEDRRKLPSHAICRNMSEGFTTAYKTAVELSEVPELVVALTGDTLITDSQSFVRRRNQMIEEKKVAMISQAWGQTFWSSDGQLTRLQGEDLPDFACCIFVIDGQFFKDTKCFTQIEVTNEYTSEECLGEELVKHLPEGNFREHISLLNTNPYAAYSYNDGVMYHARNGKPGR